MTKLWKPSRRKLITGLCASLIASPVIARPIRVHVGRPFLDAGAGGGGGGYTPSIYLFDGATMLYRNVSMIGVSDSSLGIAACLVKSTPNIGLQGIFTQCSALNDHGFPNSDFTTNEMIIPTNRLPDINDTAMYLSTDDYSSQIEGTSSFDFDTNLHQVLFAWDTNHNAGSRVIQIAVDGVLQTTQYFFDDGVAFNAAFSNVGTCIGAEGANTQTDDTIFRGFVGGLGDFYLNLSETIDLSIQSNIDQFYVSGAPTDPVTFPAGAAILITGTGLATGVNLGSAGDFDLVGTPTPSI